MDITLPDDAIHITKYTTRFHEHMIDVWFSPSTQTVYSSGKYPRLLPINDADDNYKKVRMFTLQRSFDKVKLHYMKFQSKNSLHEVSK